MKTQLQRYCFIASLCFWGLILPCVSRAQGTAFTYQGRLNLNGAAASGTYDFAFTLYNTNVNGSALAGPVANGLTAVSNGLFTTTIDFGNVFTGTSNWLELAVRTNGGASYTVLSPRQLLTPVPYALLAANAGSVPAAGITAGTANINISGLAQSATSLSGPAGTAANTFTVGTNGLTGIGTGGSNTLAGLQIASTAAAPLLTAGTQVLNGTNGYTYLMGITTMAVNGSLVALGGYASVPFNISDYDTGGITFLNGDDLSYFVTLTNGYNSITNMGRITSLAWSDWYLYVAGQDSSTVTILYCFNTPAHLPPTKVAELKNGVNGYSLSGVASVAVCTNLLAIAAQAAGTLSLVDVTTPSAPVLKLTLANGTFGFTNLAGANLLAWSPSGYNLAVGSTYTNAITLVNCSNPTSPVKLAEIRQGQNGFTNLTGLNAMVWSGNVLAIASPVNGVVTLVNVANPAAPVKLAEISLAPNGYSGTLPNYLTINSNLLAVGSSPDSTVYLYDISDPAHPQLKAKAVNGLNGLHYQGLPFAVGFVHGSLESASYGDGSLTKYVLSTNPVSLVTAGAVGIGIGSSQPTTMLEVKGNVSIHDASLVQINAQDIDLGSGNYVTGPSAMALGVNNRASGNTALAAGNSTTASGDYATSLGYGTKATGNYATALGYSTVAAGFYSLAGGQYSTANGNRSVALGTSSEADGDSSVALGIGSIASQAAALAAGYHSQSTGNSSVSLGYYANAGGDYSFAVGNSAAAYGVNSAALGYSAIANHNGSFVWSDASSLTYFSSSNTNQFLIRATGGVGINTTTPASALHVASKASDCEISIQSGDAGGRRWTLQSSGTNSTASLNTSFQIIDRTAVASRMLIDTSGNVGIGTTSPSYRLHVSGTVGAVNNSTEGFEVSGSAAGYALLDRTTGSSGRWSIYANNGSLRFFNTTDRMALNSSGLTVNGTFVSSSDRNVKENFAPVDSQAVLEKVASLPVSRWNYKEDKSQQHVGPMAQDFYAAFQVGPDDKHITTVDEGGVALAAIQGLNQKLEARSQALAAENAELKARLEKLERLMEHTTH